MEAARLRHTVYFAMAKSRVPSVQLLQALRSTIKTSRACPSTCRAQTSILQRTPVLSNRSFTTTTTRLAASSPPSIRNPTTTTSQTGNPSTPSDSASKINRYAPTSRDRGPTSTEDTQTDFSVMDIYSNTPEPATSVDACTSTGFHLNNGVKITNAAVLLAGGEAWSWKPWQTFSPTAKISVMLDSRKGTLKFPIESLGLLKMLHPKPDLLLVGTGSKTWMLDPETKKYIMQELGIRVDVMDTANASGAYNLLAKERGVDGGSGVAGAFLPIGWKGPDGAGRRR